MIVIIREARGRIGAKSQHLKLAKKWKPRKQNERDEQSESKKKLSKSIGSPMTNVQIQSNKLVDLRDPVKRQVERKLEVATVFASTQMVALSSASLISIFAHQPANLLFQSFSSSEQTL